MKKKLIFILTFLTMLVLLPSCDKEHVSLIEGAKINLTIESEASDVTVSSTYGKITKNSTYSYLIDLPIKKNLNISVSAEGYATNNLYVTTKDLETGVFNKTVSLVEKELKYYTFAFDGQYEELKCVNNLGKEIATVDNGTFEFSLGQDDLKNGIIFKAKGMESYKVSEDFLLSEGTYHNERLILTPTGTKLIRVRVDSYQPIFLTDEEGNFIKSRRITVGDYFNSSSILLTNVDSDYTGKIIVKQIYGYNDNKVISVEKNTPVYGDVIEMDMNNNHGIEMKEVFFTNYDDSNKSRLYYVNDDNSLSDLMLDPIFEDKDGEKFEKNKGVSKYRGFIPAKTKIIGFEGDVSTIIYDYNGEDEIDYTKFEPCTKYNFNNMKYLLKDGFTDELLNGKIYEKSYDSTIKNTFETVDSFFVMPNDIDTYSLEFEDGSRVSIENYNHYFAEDGLYCIASVNYQYKLSVNVILNGAPSKLDSFTVNGKPLNKEIDGTYSCELIFKNVESYNFIGSLNGKDYFASIQDLSSATLNKETHTYNLDLNLKSKKGSIINFSIRSDGPYAQLKEVRVLTGDIVFNRIMNTESQYYVYDDTNKTCRLKIKYTIEDGKDMVVDYLEYEFNYNELIKNSHENQIMIELQVAGNNYPDKENPDDKYPDEKYPGKK